MKMAGRFLLVLLLFIILAFSADAQEAEHTGAALQAEGFSNAKRLWDGDQTTWSAARDGGRITVTRADGIAGLYILFDRPPQPWTLEGSTVCGANGFLHEYVDAASLLGEPRETLTLDFPAGTAVSEVYAFSAGDLPAWVQTWAPPLEEADLMLVSSHSDDEQLFFAGLLPLYGAERGLGVQVVYFVQHFEANGRQDHRRPHEQLDGLWAVGVRSYPIISDFPDLYSQSDNRAQALSLALKAYNRTGTEDFVAYLVSCIRRCKPLVIVSHDLDGEYGHGTHVLCADALTTAIFAAADPDQYPDSAGFGPWAVEKTYLHLYDQNPVVLDLDVPLDSFNGKTAFQVTQDGFACHKSQHWTWFYKWIYGTKDRPITRAADIKRYSPCRYGLYSTLVGPDEAGGDLFEHVETYAARHARAEAEARAAREAQEEAARLQAEAEAAARAEEERLQAEAREELAARQAREERDRRNRHLAWGAALALPLAALLLLLKKRKKQ